VDSSRVGNLIGGEGLKLVVLGGLDVRRIHGMAYLPMGKEVENGEMVGRWHCLSMARPHLLWLCSHKGPMILSS